MAGGVVAGNAVREDQFFVFQQGPTPVSGRAIAGKNFHRLLILAYGDESLFWGRAVLKVNFDSGGREEMVDTFGPFDSGDAGACEVFVEADMEGFVELAEAVTVKVVDGEFGAGVFVDEGKGWGADVLGAAEGGGETLDEAGFAGAETAVEGDDGA